MADTDKKTEGLACACGKTDLYEEWLKHNENAKKKETLAPTTLADNQISSFDAAGNKDTAPVQTKK